MFDAYLLFIKDYKSTNNITFTPSQSKQENFLCSLESDFCPQKRISFSRVLLMDFIQSNCFCVADAHWFVMIPANTDNKFRIQSNIFLIVCNNHAIFLKLFWQLFPNGKFYFFYWNWCSREGETSNRQLLKFQQIVILIFLFEI